ncbi:hypothetical protein JCM8547_005670 [Rhodosporidiobolus lusitaniae]
MVRAICDLEDGEVERDATIAEEKRAEMDPLVSGCLKQLESGQAECVNPTTIFAFTNPLNKCIFMVPFPPFVTSPERALSAIRTAAFRTLTTSGRDSSALGLLFLLGGTAMLPHPQSPTWNLMRSAAWQDWEFKLGLPEGAIEQAMHPAKNGLTKADDEESTFLRSLYMQLLNDERKLDGALKVANILKGVPGANPSILDAHPQRQAESSESSAAKKKKNKKKKKKQAGPALV